MSVAELQAQHATALNAAESIISAAERAKRPLTHHEQQTLDTHLRTAGDLKPRIEAAKATPTSTANTEDARMWLAKQPRARHLVPERVSGQTPLVPDKFSRHYLSAFHSYISGGPISAAMEEGSSPAGGYAVPIVVDGEVVPLAPTDSAVRSLATVISTKSDIKTPQITARATATAKGEGSAFTVVAPTFGQFTLSCFAAGVELQTSFELAQDVDLLKAFALDDAVSAFLEYEESLFISGTGSGQAQGLIGNVGAGVTEEPDGLSNLVSIQGTLDILGQLKQTCHKGASWLMQRATSLIIRKAQVGTNLYEPVFRRENGIDLLHGYPVAYSSQMPTAARGATPILFGDFKRGYVIGDRGGPALFVKILDQAGAAQGLINLLFFRRTDGRVRRSEAVQQYTISSS